MAKSWQMINAVRILGVEAIEKARSGHPGIVLGAAPMAYTLWAEHMSHNPKNPDFFNRDRFVLSAGHGSALLYALMHVCGYDVSKEDLINFRQLNSRTPGHPEFGHTAGVETSTGPLGQGFANAVGFAYAEAALAARFNRPDLDLIDHYTYCLCGDGCMMEGITYEAASLAGAWGLGKLITLYDSNNITIEGDTHVTFREDIARRFESQGWHVLTVHDGNNTQEISAAITLAKAHKQQPSLIIVKTQIGYGSPLQGSNASHGAPLGAENVEQTKKALGFNSKPFELPKDCVEQSRALCDSLSQSEDEWKKVVREYKKRYPADYEEFLRFTSNKKLSEEELATITQIDKKADATRNLSSIMLNKLSEVVPNLVGGSADLASSNKTYLKGKGDFSDQNLLGQNIFFGIREHAMGAICNGIYLHGGFNVFCSTFLIFSDYMKHAIRMAALMKLPILYIFSHDSIGVGEDGPTHQPVEQIIGLRTIPNLRVFRPCDATETAAAYACALTYKSPTALITSRQTLPSYNETTSEAQKGGYILIDSQNAVPELILLASGSEMEFAYEAHKTLTQSGVDVRLVSMPCQELFDAQPQKYRDAVLPPQTRARLAVEAASSACWHKYVGLDGAVIGMDTFGASAPASKLFEIYGFSAENVVIQAQKVLKRCKKLTLND